jgi:hypothetical protein
MADVPPEAWDAAMAALRELPNPPSKFERDRWRIVMKATVTAAFAAITDLTKDDTDG